MIESYRGEVLVKVGLEENDLVPWFKEGYPDGILTYNGTGK